jgi:subtilisin family serine protease
MRGRKKWLFLSLALVCILALGLTLFSGGPGSTPTPSAQKMPKSLQMLCALYNDLGVQRLMPVTREQLVEVRKSATPEKQGRIHFMQKMLGADDSKLELQKSLKSDSIPALERIIDPVLQERWGNPAFEVARGMIQADHNPRSLESSYLKVRRAWKQGDTWKAFCEFAIHKAEEIVSDSSVRYLSLLPTPQLDNDLGSASTSAPRLRVGTPGNWDGSRGFTGQNVIVGDDDSGVDWAHGDFLNPDGTSRILYLWDTTVATVPGLTPEDLFGLTGLNYGRVWTQADINNGLCTEFDPSSSGGHGTHTCGTAAGNGGATGNYTGMAPNADIVFVKGLDPYGDEFVFGVARSLGRPAVCNNSWGISWAQYGPYYGLTYLFPGDGTDEYSQYFNWLMSEYPFGSIIVKSAGNNGMWHTYHDHSGDYAFALYSGSLHFGGRSKYGKPVGHYYHRIDHSFGQGMRREYSDFMIRSNVPVQVKVKFVGTGQSFTMQTGQWGEIPGASALGYGTTWFDLDQGQDPYNGEYMGVMWFDAEPSWGTTAFFPEGDWAFEVTPLNSKQVAKYDIWCYSRRSWYNSPYIYSFYDSCFRRHSSHDEYQLDWAASPDVITAGAWTTRNEWLGADGLWHYPWEPYNLEPRKNTITYFSSPGPARDGRMKPDIAAPGAIIMSAMPANLAPSIANSEKDPDLQHQWMWGTSMAAPHTTGGIALYLQKYPWHTVSTVRSKLIKWAKNDTFTRSIGKNGFGGGKLNLSFLKSVPVAVLTVDKKVVNVHQTATFSSMGSYDPDKLPYTLKWLLLAKPAGSSCQLTPVADGATLVPDKAGTYKVGLVLKGDIYNSPTAKLEIQAK